MAPRKHEPASERSQDGKTEMAAKAEGEGLNPGRQALSKVWMSGGQLVIEYYARTHNSERGDRARCC